MAAYQPISCSFYDELEMRATLGRQCMIRFRTATGEEREVRSRIVDLFTRRKEEFLLLADGRRIRLDHLISVDGISLAGYC